MRSATGARQRLNAYKAFQRLYRLRITKGPRSAIAGERQTAAALFEWKACGLEKNLDSAPLARSGFQIAAARRTAPIIRRSFRIATYAGEG